MIGSQSFMKNSKFKYFLIPKEQLLSEANILAPKFHLLFEAYNQRAITRTDLIFAIIMTVCDCRKKNEWWMKGKSDYIFTDSSSSTTMVSFFEQWGFEKHIYSLHSFFGHYRIKNLPVSVPRVLWLIDQKKIEIEIVENPIDPVEMLKLQAQGKRVVTLSRSCFLNGELVDEQRDALEFLLHDLSHANLFFSETHAEQKIFFANLMQLLNEQSVCQSLQQDELFVKDLNYIMSDMNSSKIHLLSSLRAALISNARRVEQVVEKQKISIERETRIEHQMSYFE